MLVDLKNESLETQQSVFKLMALDYFIMASDPSFEAIKTLYKKAVKLQIPEFVHEHVSSGRTLEEDLKYFEVI